MEAVEDYIALQVAKGGGMSPHHFNFEERVISPTVVLEELKKGGGARKIVRPPRAPAG